MQESQTIVTDDSGRCPHMLDCIHKQLSFSHLLHALLMQVSIMNVTDIMLYQRLSIPEYLHKRSKSMHIKVTVIETTSSC